MEWTPTYLALHSRIETDRIRMESDSDNTFTTFLLEYEYEFECSRIRIQNGCLEFGNTFGYHLFWKTTITNFLY
jgi:hypothetical protein